MYSPDILLTASYDVELLRGGQHGLGLVGGQSLTTLGGQIDSAVVLISVDIYML